MVSDRETDYPVAHPMAVLILVLMEYGLWPTPVDVRQKALMVLILVLMEYGLWLY